MQQADRLGLGRLAAFSLPVVLFQAIELGWRAYLPSFLTQSIGLSFAAVGLLMIGARIFDSAADPLVGWLSDRTRSRFGRRKPWMVAGVPLVALGALALFLVPTGTGFAMVAAASLALHLGYSLIVTPHGGWGLELSNDSHERTRIMGAKVWFAAAGSIVLLLAFAVLERRFGMDRMGLAAALGIVIAVLAPISIGLVVALFRERPESSRLDHNPLTLLRVMSRQRRLRMVMLLYLIGASADACSMGSFLFFAENVLGLNGWGASLLMIPPLLALATLPAWSELSRRIGRERTLAIAYGWQAVTAPFALLLPVGGLWPFAAYLLLRNLSWGVDYMLLRAMVADIADENNAGEARASGSYYALTSVALKVAMGIGGAAAVWTIGLAGFSAATPVTETEQLAIRLVFAGPAALAGLAGTAVLLVFSLFHSERRLPGGGEGVSPQAKLAATY